MPKGRPPWEPGQFGVHHMNIASDDHQRAQSSADVARIAHVPYRHARQSEVTIAEIIAVAWAGKYLVACLAIAFGVAAGITGWLLPREYEASTTLEAVAGNSGNGQLGTLGSLASQFGGLASLAGISLSDDSKKAESVAVLQSEALTQQYIQQNNLLPILYAKEWDASRSRWRPVSPKHTPTLWTANRFFKKHVRSVTTDSKTGLVTLTIKWTDPKLAAQWANGLVKMTNDYLRDKAIRESEQHIAYLDEQASKTDLVGVKQVIYELLEQQINKMMMARGSDEYALRVIDPAFIAERPSSLGPLAWTLIGIFGGLVIGTGIVVGKNSVTRH